jgi:Holliday junction DNA helicase RuvA
MIGFLRGTITHLFSEYCFIDVQGVGYRVFIPASTRQELAVNASVTLLTYLNVREDALLLFGFYTNEEYELFQHLISVNGVGPKVALGVLSAITPNDFRLAVSQKNAALLTRIPGIGKKTAERIILELKDKIGLPDDAGALAKLESGSVAVAGDAVTEALQALLALGYSQGEVAPVVAKLAADGQTAQELIKLTLREFARR